MKITELVSTANTERKAIPTALVKSYTLDSQDYEVKIHVPCCPKGKLFEELREAVRSGFMELAMTDEQGAVAAVFDLANYAKVDVEKLDQGVALVHELRAANPGLESIRVDLSKL